ncbi:MAG: hypothetical protein ABI333_31040 [bacterium]
MNLADLDTREKHILGAFIRLMLRSDGRFSEQEEEQVNRIGEPLGGAEQIWHLISESAQAFPDEGQARQQVLDVSRAEARSIILGILEQVAGADGVESAEAELLDWLRQQWA